MNAIEHISLGTAATVFGAAFGMWAWVVAWGVGVIRREVADLKTEVALSRADTHRQMLEIEHRLTAVESDIKRCAVFNAGGLR